MNIIDPHFTGSDILHFLFSPPSENISEEMVIDEMWYITHMYRHTPKNIHRPPHMCKLVCKTCFMLSGYVWVWLTDCRRSGSASDLRSSSTISQLPCSQHNIRADSPPCMTVTWQSADQHMTHTHSRPPQDRHTADQHKAVHAGGVSGQVVGQYSPLPCGLG